MTPANPAPTFATALKAWHAKPGRTRKWGAMALCVPRSTYDGWCAGNPCGQERAMRKLMVMIDDAEKAGWRQPSALMRRMDKRVATCREGDE